MSKYPQQNLCVGLGPRARSVNSVPNNPASLDLCCGRVTSMALASMSYIDGDNLTIKECCGCNSALRRRLQCGPGLHDSTQTVHHIYSCRAYSCMLPEVSLTCHTHKCNTGRLKKYLCMLVEVKYADEQNAGHLRDILSTERAMKAFILCYTS